MTCSLSMLPLDKYFLVPIQSYSDGESYSGEACGIEVETFEECLFVRVDYPITDKYLVENFKCIGSDHERAKDENGRITSI